MMKIQNKPVRIFLLSSMFFLLPLFGYTQDTVVELPIKEGYKKWTKPRLAGRMAIGYQKELYVEFGLAQHRYIYTDRGSAAKVSYAAFEWSQPKNVYAFKAGYEINLGGLALGIEAKYQFYRATQDIVITPKIGAGTLGMVNFFYGYNISLLGMPFPNIGHHQISMVFNFNKHLFTKTFPSGVDEENPATNNP